MAVYKAVVSFTHVSGLPEDQVQNTLWFSTNEGDTEPGTAAVIAGDVLGAYATADNDAGTALLQGFLSDELSRTAPPRCRVYDLLGGSPIADEVAAGNLPAAIGAALPGEVAVCLSYRADYGGALEFAPDDGDADAAPERPRSSFRGRIFFGPLTNGASALSPPRPSTNVVQGLLSLATELGNIGDNAGLFGLEGRWITMSAQRGSGTIVEAWVDNAFDTQRRRGVAASSRTSLAIAQP